jgi:hypothetical protein
LRNVSIVENGVDADVVGNKMYEVELRSKKPGHFAAFYHASTRT